MKRTKKKSTSKGASPEISKENLEFINGLSAVVGSISKSLSRTKKSKDNSEGKSFKNVQTKDQNSMVKNIVWINEDPMKFVSNNGYEFSGTDGNLSSEIKIIAKGGIDVLSSRIENIGNPENDLDAANKQYVDNFSPVTSVNGKTGAVVLDASDVGAVSTSGETLAEDAELTFVSSMGQSASVDGIGVYIIGGDPEDPSYTASVYWPQRDGQLAVTDDLPYALATVELDAGDEGSLSDRTINMATDPTALDLPGGTPGLGRDFLVRLTLTSASSTVIFIPPFNETISYETESGDWPDLSAAGTYLLRFTETAQTVSDGAVTAATFLVQCGACKAATQPQNGGAA